ncbi:MAG TPA: SprT family zinc-dependent metalloprotease, partial [Casimicrobiaceae bacterium]
MRLEAPPARRTDASLRRVVLNGETVDYRLIRARRRSIGMEVHLDGLTVRAPMRVALREIETALVERAKWILDALAQWRGRRRDVMPREWRTGETIAFRGDTLALALHPARRTGIVADLFHLVVRHPHAYDQLAVAQCVVGWLREQAQALVAPRVMHHVRRIGLRSTPSVRLSNARSEWGSCNASGDIRLNWRLVQLAPALAEYVVAHEVAHIVELNHSRRFWDVVEALMPGHAA